MRTMIALLCVLVTGCASLAPVEANWSDKERIAFAASIGAHALDAGTTVAADFGKCREANPIYGDSPSAASVIAVKLAAIGLEYWLYNSSPESAHWYGFTSAVVIGYVGIHNLQQDCY